MSTKGPEKDKKDKRKKRSWFKRLRSPRSPRDEGAQEPSQHEHSAQQPSVRDYQDVFLACASYLMKTEDFTSTEGIFRVPGTASDVEALTNEIIKNDGKMPNTTLTNNIHTVIGAMKGIIKKIGFINQELDSVKAFREAVLQDNLQDAPELIQAILDELHATGNKIDRDNANIIDAYLDLAMLASLHQDVTKMDPKNCATVMMMTFDVFMLNLSPLDALQHQSKLGTALETKIQDRLSMRQEAEHSIDSIEDEVESYIQEISPRKSTQTAITHGQVENRAKQKGQLKEVNVAKEAEKRLEQPTQDETTKKTPRGKHTGKG